MDRLVNIYSQAFRLAYIGCSYSEIRLNFFPEYNSQTVANAIYDTRWFRKAVLAKHKYPKQLNPALLLRKQDYRIDGNTVSIIYKPRNRIKVKVFPSEKQLKKIKNANQKGARLVKRDGKFFLDITLEKEVNIPKWSVWDNWETIIGVDIGVNYLAVCSAINKDRKFLGSKFFHGGEWKHLCDRKRKINTSSRSYKQLTNRQTEILHTASKQIVEFAKQFPKPVIILEKFGRFKTNFGNGRLNFILNSWSKSKLQKMIKYKANWEGIPVVYTNPVYTSVTCHYCGERGKREGKIFKCSGCGRTLNADLNASINLAKRFLLRQFSDEPQARTGERSSEGMIPSGEGKTYLPNQTYIQPENGNQMNGLKLRQTVRLPIGSGR